MGGLDWAGFIEKNPWTGTDQVSSPMGRLLQGQPDPSGALIHKLNYMILSIYFH